MFRLLKHRKVLFKTKPNFLLAYLMVFAMFYLVLRCIIKACPLIGTAHVNFFGITNNHRVSS